MKTVLLFGVFSILMLDGCSETKYIYVEPEYPTLTAPINVQPLKNVYVRKGCLFIDIHNTNLCNDDLKVVLTQINKYKVNQSTCIKMIQEYDNFKNEYDANRNKTTSR